MADAEVRNAVGVSLLEHIGFDGRHALRINYRGMLSAQLQSALRDLEDYNTSIGLKKKK